MRKKGHTSEQSSRMPICRSTVTRLTHPELPAYLPSISGDPAASPGRHAGLILVVFAYVKLNLAKTQLPRWFARRDARVDQLGRQRQAVSGVFVDIPQAALCQMNRGETFVARLASVLLRGEGFPAPHPGPRRDRLWRVGSGCVLPRRRGEGLHRPFSQARSRPESQPVLRHGRLPVMETPRHAVRRRPANPGRHSALKLPSK
jgi:hypothetical protein